MNPRIVVIVDCHYHYFPPRNRNVIETDGIFEMFDRDVIKCVGFHIEICFDFIKSVFSFIITD